MNPTEFDYSSIGVKSRNLSPEEIANTARGDLSGFEATQHLITDHQVKVEGESATCQAHVRAIHFLPNEDGDSIFEMGGYYTVHLIRDQCDWKIQRWKFRILWSSGNQDLFKLARATL
ncbi:nuclear transport factor 2 family protein [Mastigocoleus testarum]|uniref:nuclear transport factor 2 family protein n=1 Tax=Mastigocoleus testarum TaxID=996925 RepID=UPI0009E8E7A3|nr:nuclear transport factor 2 family protein [Mastigocoleus testarum]